MKKGNVVTLVLAVLLLSICTITSLFALNVVSSNRENTQLMLEASVMRGVRVSAEKLLRFSMEHGKKLAVEINGYHLETDEINGSWCVRLDNGDEEEIIFAEGR
jgi:hypothetical protein